MDFTSISALIFAIIVFFASSSTSEKAPYATFAKDATKAPAEEHYDYIIVGGGTAGCPLAATLSQSAKVLVLERGDLPYNIPTVNTIYGYMYSLYNLLPSSPCQTFVSTDGVVSQRGRVLGGGSAVNAGFFTWASDEFVKEAGWDPKLVRESYEWVGNKVAFKPKVLAWQEAVKEGLLEVGVSPDNGFTYEHKYGTKVGGSIFDQNGKRHTAADLLEFADPGKITVYLKATVNQILFETNEVKAKGVMYQDLKGALHVALLNNGGEVILSAGTLGSPQLLMLSGIGPSKHLMGHGIKVVLDQPNVGQGLSDNPMNFVLLPSIRPVDISLIEVVGITQVGSFIETASLHLDWTSLYTFGAHFGLFPNKTLAYANLRSLFTRHFQVDPLGVNVGIILEKVNGPRSLGFMELDTKNPNDNPKVTFNYFKDPQDLQSCVQGMETIIKVLESKAFSKFRMPLLTVRQLLGLVVSLPLNFKLKHVTAPFNLEQYCQDTVMTIWHYHGGCQVDKVIDRDYKVNGVGALRVIDSSTLLSSPGTNPQATMMMLGRYMGQKILQERSTSGRK